MRRVTFGLLTVLAFAAALTPISDGDIWWHLATGREIVRTGWPPTSDTFSIGAAGRPWIDVHWLFQLLAHGAYRLGGVLALVVGKALVIAGGAALLLLAVDRGAAADGVRIGCETERARSAARFIFVSLLLLTLLAVRPLLLMRPVVLTLLFLALFTWLIERFRAGGRARALWLLPILQIIWVNCQGLSPLGPLLIFCHAAGGALAARWGRAELPGRGPRRLLAAGLACLAAGLATPYGLSGFLFPLQLLARIRPGSSNVFSENIAENIPPFLLERSSPGQLWHLSWFLGLLAASLVLGRRHLVVGRCLAAVTFVGLGLMATRNLLLAYWVAAPVIALNSVAGLAPRLAGRFSETIGRSRARFVSTAAFAAMLLVIGALTGVALRRETALATPAPFRVPVASVKLIASRGGESAIFAADHYGGYVIWALYPQHRPFMDTRLILRTAEEYETFLGALSDPRRFEPLHRRYQFRYVLVPTAFPDRYLGLIQHLYRASEWKLLYTDGTETLFAHDPAGVEAGIDLASPEVNARILAGLADSHPDRAVLRAARVHLARLQLALEHWTQARAIVDGMPTTDIEAQSLLALAHLLAGDVARSEAVASAAAAADPKAVMPLHILARVALHRGDRPAGLAWLRRALVLDPYDPESQSILGQLESAGSPSSIDMGKP